MKYFLSILFITIVFSSCKRDCEGFDLTRNVNKWHWFPNNPLELNFRSDSQQTISFVRSSFILTQQTGGYGSMEKCPTKYHKSSYSSLDYSFQIASSVSYDSDHYTRPDHDSNMRYEFNLNAITYQYDEINLNVVTNTYQPKAETIIDTLYHSFKLNNIEYENLYELKTKELTTDIQKTWFQQYTGIIGIQVNDTIYIKQ